MAFTEVSAPATARATFLICILSCVLVGGVGSVCVRIRSEWMRLLGCSNCR